MSDLNPNSGGSFGDPKRLFVGVIVVFGFMALWQMYLHKRYPNMNQPKPAASAEQAAADAKSETVGSANPGSISAETNLQAEKTADAKTAAPRPEKLFAVDDAKVSFTLSSRGMGLREYVIKTHKDKEGNPIRLGASTVGDLFEMRLAGQSRPIDFDVQEVAPGHYEGSARTEVGLVKRRLRFDHEKGSFESLITVTDASPELAKGITLLVPATIHATGSSSWLFPSYERQEFYVGHSNTTEALNINHAKENIRHDYQNVSFVSVGDQYFSTAILDRSDVMPSVTALADVAAKTAQAELSYKPVQTNGELVFQQILYAGPKEIDALNKIDPAMASIIDFGFLKVIAKPLLWVMKSFHAVVGNWGFAIILLTLMVRFVVLPFNVMSFRSMKAMQKIQPHMQAIREKYKDDPMQQQKEIMALMKTHKANPLGGCLPMLLQIPVFFALYQVIGSSVELYQSPFIGWIHDLSAHDPFYVLPVLMGVTMFFQSKLTPTTADPAQQKVMQWLPVVFTVFMLQLPAGLTLYMVVSAVFGIVQQWFILREPKTAAVTVK